MTKTLIEDSLSALLAEHEAPCLSLYLPTHRRHPENQQDPIRYKNLLKTLEEAVARQYPGNEKAAGVLERFRALNGDTQLWNHAWDGLAVLGAPGVFEVIKLQKPVNETVVAAESFHLKPLLRVWQGNSRYQVLGLSRKQVRLFEGNREHLDEVTLAPEVPATLAEALGEELTDPHQTVASYGGVSGESGAMHHGHGGRRTEVELDEERFFRVVDRAILDHHSRPSGLPLVIAALAQHQTPFRQVSHNPFVMEKGVEVDPGALTTEQLRQRAWAVVEPELVAREQKLLEQFGNAQAAGLGSGDLEQVAQAVAASRVATLFVEGDRRIPGTVDLSTGSVTLDGTGASTTEDVLDDLAEAALRRGGEVVVLPAEAMPVKGGVAAIFRF